MAQASEALIRQITRAVVRWAPPYVDAEDIAQEVRLACWEAEGAHRGARGYWWTCGLRAGLRWIRTEAHLRGVTERQFRAGVSRGREVALDAVGEMGRDGLAGRVVGGMVAEAFLDTLHPRERAAVVGARDGYTSAETATALGMSACNVRRDLMHLRRRYEEGLPL